MHLSHPNMSPGMGQALTIKYFQHLGPYYMYLCEGSKLGIQTPRLIQTLIRRGGLIWHLDPISDGLRGLNRPTSGTIFRGLNPAVLEAPNQTSTQSRQLRPHFRRLNYELDYRSEHLPDLFGDPTIRHHVRCHIRRLICHLRWCLRPTFRHHLRCNIRRLICHLIWCLNVGRRNQNTKTPNKEGGLRWGLSEGV